MAVNLSVPLASELKPVSGLELGYAKANIKLNKRQHRSGLLSLRRRKQTRLLFCARTGEPAATLRRPRGNGACFSERD